MTLGSIIRRETRRKRVVVRSAEFRRIKDLPRRATYEDLTPAMTEWLRAPGGSLTLRPVQAWALSEVYANRGAIISAAVGSGKTIIGHLAPVVLAETEKGCERPLMLVKAALVDKAEADRVRLMQHFRHHPNLRILSYEKLSNVNYAKFLFEYMPDAIIADECFLGDARVSTLSGTKRISEVLPGDQVLSWDGEKTVAKRVKAVMEKSLSQRLVKIRHEGGELVCTEGHKIWVESNDQQGYRKAISLLEGDHLRVLRRKEDSREQGTEEHSEVLLVGVRKSMGLGSGEDERSAEGAPEMRRPGLQQRGKDTTEVLFGRVQKLSEAGAPSLLGLGRGEISEKKALRENEEAQPHLQSGDSREDVESDEGADLSLKGREWEVNEATGEAARYCGRGNGVGHTHSRHYSVQEPSPCVQGGHWIPSSEGSSGDRREFSQDEEVEVSRSKERGDTELLRVVSIEILESGGRREHRGSSEENLAVYDLEVEDTHCYFVEGALVSNCQMLRHVARGRGKRMRDYLNAYPETAFVGMTGSLTRRSIKDYAKLTEWSLKEGSPLPKSFYDACDWADALDENVPDGERIDPGALMDFCENGEPPRIGYRRRFVETPGVITTEESLVDTGLVLRECPIEVPPVIRNAFDTLAKEWELPGGDTVSTVLDWIRHAEELSQGYYNRWVWGPSGPDVEWLMARSAWRKFVHKVIKNSRSVSYDTELQVANAVRDGTLICPADEYNQWHNIKGRANPKTEAVWLSDFMIDKIMAWLENPTMFDPPDAEKDTAPVRGIVWVEHSAVLTRLKEKGANVFFAGDDSIRSATVNCAASLGSHGVGKDLQQYNRNLWACVPDNATSVEQCIGRTHRAGQNEFGFSQEAETVYFDMFLHCRQLWTCWEKVKRQAEFIRDTTGQNQRIDIATLDLKTSDRDVISRALAGDPLWQDYRD